MTTSTIVIPCYNEADRLNVETFRTYVEMHAAVRMLFVNDGSQDQTGAMLDELAAGSERIDALHLEQNAGKAEAVRQGMLAASTHDVDIIGFWDADLSTGLEEIEAFLNIFEERPEIEMVFGSRVNLLGRRVRRKLWRHYIGRFFATIAAWMLSLPIYDTQCGAKMFRNTDEFRTILAAPFLSRWIFDVELLARYIVSRRDTEQPQVEDIVFERPLMAWYDVAGSKLRPRDMFIVARDLSRIRRRCLR
ncbi:MAG: glycosyltransferase [Planctomycetota bacterium]